MISYSFSYRDDAGGLIRQAAMQCASDFEAIRQACDTMQDKYIRLEILAGERLVFCQSLAAASRGCATTASAR